MKLKNNKGKTSALVIILYIIAAGMLLAFLLSFYDVTSYIWSLHVAGSISLSADWFDCIIYYMNNTLEYLGYAVVIFALGYIISYIKKKKQPTIETENTIEENK